MFENWYWKLTKNVNHYNLLLILIYNTLLLALLQIKEVGIQKTLDSIEQLKAQNLFKHKEYYSR